jgi:regulatory protein
VEVDGRVVATVSLAAIERLSLRVGLIYDDRLRGAVDREDAITGAVDRALAMLAFRARSVRDLRRRLVQKGESGDVADAALARLVELGLLDDAAYARQFVRSRVQGAGLSRRRLEQELFRRGVAREVADTSIAEVMAEDAVDVDAILGRVARKKLRTLGQLDPAVRRRRLYGYLARRGYDPDEIRRVMEEMSGPIGEGEGERGTGE